MGTWGSGMRMRSRAVANILLTSCINCVMERAGGDGIRSDGEGRGRGYITVSVGEGERRGVCDGEDSGRGYIMVSGGEGERERGFRGGGDWGVPVDQRSSPCHRR